MSSSSRRQASTSTAQTEATRTDAAYVGERYVSQGIHEKTRVYRGDGTELTPARSREHQTHSRGFEWGYGGSGPAQLALAILLDHYDDEALALAYYQRFCTIVVADLEADVGDTWRLTADEIDDAVEEIEAALDGDHLAKHTGGNDE